MIDTSYFKRVSTLYILLEGHLARYPDEKEPAMPNNNLKLLGKRIHELRVSRGYSQEGLSEQSSVSSRHISEIERGNTNPTFEALGKIADALGVTLVDLLDFRHHRENADLCQEIHETLKSLPDEKLVLVYKIVKAILG